MDVWKAERFNCSARAGHPLAREAKDAVQKRYCWSMTILIRAIAAGLVTTRGHHYSAWLAGVAAFATTLVVGAEFASRQLMSMSRPQQTLWRRFAECRLSAHIHWHHLHFIADACRSPTVVDPAELAASRLRGACALICRAASRLGLPGFIVVGLGVAE